MPAIIKFMLMNSGRNDASCNWFAGRGLKPPPRNPVAPESPACPHGYGRAMEPGAITSEWLSGVLGSDVELVGSTRIGDGLVGMNLRLELGATGGVPDRLIAKLPSPDPTSRATGIALRNYEREVKFYNEIQPTVDIRVPHCHFADWNETTGDFVLVMEDMAPAEQGDQIAGCSVAEAEAAAKRLRVVGVATFDDALRAVRALPGR